MKKYLAFIQFACIAGGAYAFATKNWSMAAVFWGAVVITYYLQKADQPESKSGQPERTDAPQPEPHGLDLLDTGMAALMAGNYTEAKANLRSAVSQFKAANDQRLIVVGLTFQAVTETADREFDTARVSLAHAGNEREKLPTELLQISGWLREIHGLTGDVLALGVPNPETYVAEIQDIAERAAREPW